MNSFGSRLRILRLEKNLNGIELGKIFNFSKSTISSWENETREPPHKVLMELAKFFDVSIDYLMGNSDIRSPAKISDPIIIDEDTKNFTNKLVNELLKQGMITDIENIPSEITDMIIAALKTDLKRIKKEAK